MECLSFQGLICSFITKLCAFGTDSFEMGFFTKADLMWKKDQKLRKELNFLKKKQHNKSWFDQDSFYTEGSESELDEWDQGDLNQESAIESSADLYVTQFFPGSFYE